MRGNDKSAHEAAFFPVKSRQCRQHQSLSRCIDAGESPSSESRGSFVPMMMRTWELQRLPSIVLNTTSHLTYMIIWRRRASSK
ncbi:Protein of unknown function [Pyronema omphalodes CBS 100304]|uniref:Uncharacterized protein n=1 Tax=Pyronema omphalodes (strain CBS 100304) TaxID=1076935 RepID=U4LD52_PYROM|nr:Protein of unknown function [Pyronema omphalodes CBS 100304]